MTNSELKKLIRKVMTESDQKMKELWYVKKTNGGVINISTSKDKAEDFLWDKLKGDGDIHYVEVPLEDWNSEKVNVSNISHYAKKLYRESKDGNEKIKNLKRDLINAVDQKIAVPFNDKVVEKTFDKILQDLQSVINSYKKSK